MRFGIERLTTSLDNNGSTLTIINTIREGKVIKSYKQRNERVKVFNSKEEMAEYLKHAELIRDKRKLGLLVTKEDPSLQPTFKVEYPKYDEDGSYFVVKSWTEYTEL